jgi:putative transposase
MPDYRRHRVPGGTYFFTVNLAERRLALLIEHIAVLREAFHAVRLARPFSLEAIVVLPDHLHCLWTLPPDDDDFASRWAQIKAGFSRRIPHGERRRVSRMRKRERGVWQRRYWEHLIRNDEDFSRHLDYIHFNPVKHGYVRLAGDWPHSSFRRWMARGVYPSDWSGGA